MKRLMLWVGIAATFAVVGCKKSVPRVEGQDLKTATSKLENSGFKVGAVGKTFTGTSDSGTVVSQNPAAATKMAKGSVVDLIIEESVTLQAFVGMDSLSARRAAAAQGLRISPKNKPTKEAPAGTVLDQSPLAGQRVPPGTVVELLVAGEKGILDPFVDADTRDGLEGTAKGVISNKVAEVLSGFLNGHGDKDKDSHKKNGNDKGKGSEKEKDKGTGKGVGQVLGDEFNKQIDKGFDKAIDKGFDKGFGKDTAKDFAKDFGKGAVRKFGDFFGGHGRKDSAKGETDSSEALAAPVQLSPFQGEQVHAPGNRVNFVWTEVEGAASYIVEIEARSGKKNWSKLQKKSDILETHYVATVLVPEARWRVRAVDSNQKDGLPSVWASFARSASGENVSTPVPQSKQLGPAQVVSK